MRKRNRVVERCDDRGASQPGNEVIGGVINVDRALDSRCERGGNSRCRGGRHRKAEWKSERDVNVPRIYEVESTPSRHPYAHGPHAQVYQRTLERECVSPDAVELSVGELRIEYVRA